MDDLSRLLAPQSVAIVGASPTPGSLGNSVLRNLERHGFSGDIHLINPKRKEIHGRPCLASIEDLPTGVDAAILAIPGPAILPAIRSLASRRAGSAIIFSAGFAEGGEEGMAAQAEIARIALDSGMIIEGPNCLGMINYSKGIPLTFVETPILDLTGKPTVGIISQSGAMAVVLGTTLMSKDLGISLSISTGNEAVTGVEDYVRHLLDDPDTSAIGMIVEQFRKPQAFLDLAERALEAGKPIVLLHPGTSRAARESAATHTGAMAGDWKLMQTMVERAGIILVDSLESLGDVLELTVRAKPLRPGGVAVLTESGAFKAMTLDLADRIGLPLPSPGGKTEADLRQAVPDFIPVSNPMDLTAQALVDPDLYRRTMIPLLEDDNFAALVFGIIQTDEATSERKFPPIIDAVHALAPNKPILFAGLDEGAPVPAPFIRSLREKKIAYFPSPERAFRALRHLNRFATRDFSRATDQPICIDLPSGTLAEYRAKSLLADAISIPFPRGELASTVEEAKGIAAGIGYPVALKAQSAALTHKTDAGGVILNLADEDALEESWHRLIERVRAHDPELRLDGILVEAMSRPGVELIIGARNDREWGPVILAGFGGVTAELLQDFRLLPADLSRSSIMDELRLLKQSALFDGYRGSPPLDLDSVASLITRLGRLLAGTPAIREIDLNPIVLYPEGEGIVALDALILAD